MVRMAEVRSRERSGLQRIKCRACLKEIYWQNYKDHLRTKHQQEDCNDVRVHGQSSLFAFSTLKRKEPSDELEDLKTTKHEDTLEGSEEIAIEGSEGSEMELNMEEGDLTDSEEDLQEDESEGKVDEGLEEVPMGGAEVEVSLEEDLGVKEIKDRKEMEQVDVKAINKVLQQILAKEEVTVEACQSEIEKLNKYLNILEKRVQIKGVVQDLVENLKELKMTEGEAKIIEKPESLDDESLITMARSMKEITEKVPVFVYHYEEHLVRCIICKQTFGYKEEEINFTENHMSLKFSNLKMILKRHLTRETHLQIKKELEGASVKDKEKEARNKVIGKTIGGLIYHLVYKGRPDTDLPLLIYRVKMAGGDVGDINHSHNLVAALLPEISAVVAGRLKKMLSTPMKATGSLPPVNIMADKATDKRYQL